jgi:hypothetical protein
LEKNNSLTRVIIHVSNWTRLLYTHVQLDACIRIFNTRVYLDTCINTCVHIDMCIKYTCPSGVFIQLATMSKRHVANWTHVYSNRYCRHASNCRVFCSARRKASGSPLLAWTRGHAWCMVSSSSPSCRSRGRAGSTIRRVNRLSKAFKEKKKKNYKAS